MECVYGLHQDIINHIHNISYMLNGKCINLLSSASDTVDTEPVESLWPRVLSFGADGDTRVDAAGEVGGFVSLAVVMATDRRLILLSFGKRLWNFFLQNKITLYVTQWKKKSSPF